MEMEGIEPPTPRASVVCSPTELHLLEFEMVKAFLKLRVCRRYIVHIAIILIKFNNK